MSFTQYDRLRYLSSQAPLFLGFQLDVQLLDSRQGIDGGHSKTVKVV